MFTNIFENRDQKLKKIFALTDSLARSLRKGVEVFNIDGDNVTFVTEDHKIIKGKLEDETLSEIKVEDGKVFSDPDVFDKYLQEEVTQFVASLNEDNFTGATSKFSNVLRSWGQLTTFDRINRRLQDKIENLLPQGKIIDSAEFNKLTEMKEELVKILKENKEKILEKEQIVNSVLLCNKISKAFDLPKVTYESLENSPYTIRNTNYAPIYEILCKQELIKKELLEAKENMDSIWASDDSITLLTTKIYESNQEVIESIVAKIISKIPYFAFASKIQIANLLENSLSLQESEVKTTDIKEFASRIFEMKKPVRQELSKVLSQRYGISIQNLKETPSLNSLKNSIVTIFESLARVSSKTVLKDTLKEFAGFLRGKSGVEVLDVNDFLHEVFTLAEYPLNENNLMQYMDFGRVADDVLKIGTVLKMIQQSSQPALGTTPPQVGIPAQASVAQTVPQAAPTLTPGMPGQGVPDEQYPSDETIGGGGMQPQPNTAGNPVASAQMAGQDMAMQQGGGMEQQPNAPTPMDPNALVQQLSVLDQLLQDLQFQLGRAGGGEGGMIPHGEDPGMEGEGIPGEEGMEGEEGDFEDEEEGLPDEDVDGDGDEDIEYVDMTDEEGEESEEETPPKKKKENKPKE